MTRLDHGALTPVSRPGGTPSRQRRWAEVALAGAVYLLLACLAYGRVGPLDTRQLAGCPCSDPVQQTWFLAWTPFAVLHGLNPFVTTYLNAPAGANLAVNTSMPLLGLLGTPMTLLAGPVATYNLLLRLGLALSGMAMFGVLRRYTSWWPAAFGGGLLFAFCPYLAGQAQKHLFLVFLPLVPLFIPLLDDWLVSLRRSPWRSGLLIGLVAGLQYLISAEILLTCAIFAAVGLIFLALRHSGAVRQRLGVFARGLAVAVPVFLVIAGYAVWMLLAGPARPVGPLHPVGDLARFHGDLLGTLLPSGNQALAPAGLTRLGNGKLAGQLAENGFYLGLPLLALVGYLAVRCRRTGIVAVSVVIGVTAFVLSLGTKLTVNGTVLVPVMPFGVLTHLPVLQNLEAARLSMFIQLAAVIVVSVGLDRVRAEGWRGTAAERPGQAGTAAEPPGRAGTAAEPPGRAGTAAEPPGRAGTARPLTVAAVGLVALLPLLPALPFASAPARAPALFTSHAAEVRPAGAVALTFPFSRVPNTDAMLWQAASGMRFRIVGGYVIVPGPDGRSTWQLNPPGPPVISAIFLAGTKLYPKAPPAAQPQTLAAIRLLCARERVGVILIQRTAHYAPAVARLVGKALGTPPSTPGQMDVWLNVQRDLLR
jgi:hypothetical protein